MDIETLRPMQRAFQVRLHAGREAKGEQIGSYSFWSVPRARDGMVGCVQAVAAERSPPAPRRDEGPPRSLVAWNKYITDADYPAPALRAGDAGQVSFRLDIAEDGYPDGPA